MWLLGLVIACGGGAYEGKEPGDCTDLADNDADGAFDCDDEGCAGSPECAEDTDTDTVTDTDTDDTDVGDTDTDVGDTDTDVGDTDTGGGDTDTGSGGGDTGDVAARWSGVHRLPGDVVLRGHRADENAGNAVDVGDFDGDGQADVLVAAYASNEGTTYGGAVYLVRGPITADMSLSSATAILAGEGDHDFLGYTARFVRDADGDGDDEIVIGAPNGEGPTGHTYLVHGGAIAGTHAIGDVADTWTGESANDYVGGDIDDAGDVTGDGVEDVVVGAQQSSFYVGYGGAAYVLSGASTGDHGLSSAPVRIYGKQANEALGIAVAGLGDVDGDGQDDLAIGDAGGTGTQGLLVYQGPLSGNLFSTDADARLIPPAGLNGTPQTVSGGHDLDGDGTPDIAIGSPAYSDGSTFHVGQVAVVSGPKATGELDLRFADAIITGQTAEDLFGYTVVSPGDLDGDGVADLLVGAVGADPHGNVSGSAYLFYGALSGTSAPSDAAARFDGDDANWYAGIGLAGGRDLTGDGVGDLLFGCMAATGDASYSGLATIVAGTP